MIVLTFSRQPGVNPVLLAFSVVSHIRVTQRRQLTGGVLGSVSSRTGAVNYNIRHFVRQECRSKLGHLIGRQVDCARQVRMMIRDSGQSFDKEKALSSINLLLQFIS